ncbi:MAG: hypothetical protein EXS47_00195 [Candidatus Zambryskibacteria bacterium]|nr:hypothetical protein [Candidatus Zambryskibacteria bacterium]
MKTSEGFIGKVLLIIVAILFAKYYFDFDVLVWAKSPEEQSFIAPLISIIKQFYVWADGVVRSIVT